MNTLYLLSLKAFIDNSSCKTPEGLYKYFEEDVQKSLKSLQGPLNIPLSFLKSSETLLNVHYSWLKPLFEEMNPQEGSLYFSALPTATQSSLTNLLSNCPKVIELSSFAKKFFLERLFLKFSENTPFLPVEFIPKSPLNTLLSIKKSYLVWLIDILGIQDLSLDLRKVLDKRILDDIFNKLEEHQKKYLKSILNRGDLPLVKSEDLAYWLKGKDILLNQIHQKGLHRLSIALLGQNESLIWHISRLLDTGRGSELIKNLQDTRLKAINPKLKEQITANLLSLLTLFKESTP
jgi:hypothetical protein